MASIVYIVCSILTFMVLIGYFAYEGDSGISSWMLNILAAFLMGLFWPFTIVVGVPIILGRRARARLS